jgi:tetratricopeptide (TPR) repeat protein
VALDGRQTAADESCTRHPSDETLATYVDGGLASAERLHTERHLAICPSCRAVVTRTVSLMAEHAAPPAPSVAPFPWRPLMAGGLAAAAAALVLYLAALPDGFGRSAPPNLEALVAAFAAEPTRLAEARVTGGFVHRPAPALVRGAAGPGSNRLLIERSPDVRIAVAAIETAAQRSRSPEARWRLGVARLALGDVDEAVTNVKDASRALVSNAQLHSDLAAAYLTRARMTASQDDAKQALRAADRALALEPGLPEALFNRALALEVLRMPDAGRAWEAVALTESDPAWVNEAKSRQSPVR